MLPNAKRETPQQTPVMTAGPRRRTAPLRVLHVIHALVHGGMERVLVDLVQGTSAEKFESHVLTLELLGPLAEELAPIATVHRSKPVPGWSMLWPQQLARQIREIAPDIVHTHGRVWYKASLAARLAGVRRIVHTDHGRGNPDPWLQRRIDRIAAQRTDAVVAVSQSLADHLRSRVIGAHRALQVITNGVDTRRYRPAPDDGSVRRAHGIPLDAPIIGTVGRFDPIKAYDMMVEAFAILLRSWGAAQRPVLTFVGDGSERALIERTADRLGIRESIRITGLVRDVARYHATLAVFSLSSHSEGTSISLLEAMSAGVCPVVTDVGGNAACLGDSLAHRLVPSSDPAALADAWRSALTNDVQRAADAAAARQRVQQHFALDRMVERYASLYEIPARTSSARTVFRREVVEHA